MSVLQSIQSALMGVGVTIGFGKYPETTEPCGKVIFTDKDKPSTFLGGSVSNVETFKVVVRGGDYNTLVLKADAIKNALKNTGFIQIGGYEDVEAKEGEAFMQLSVSFKSIK